MNKPKMILFDYGQTLMREDKPDFLMGEAAVFAHVKHNPHNATMDVAMKLGNKLFENAQAVRDLGDELREDQLLKAKYDALGIRFDVSMGEIEDILWNAACPGVPTFFAAHMLRELERRRIRTGVISNLCWTGDALKRRLRKAFPEHTFDCVITSSDYGVRKPHRLLFMAALEKAGVSARDAWYCGDNYDTDVWGASRMGMFPVWYESDMPGIVRKEKTQEDVEHLHITNWYQLLDHLDALEGKK